MRPPTHRPTSQPLTPQQVLVLLLVGVLMLALLAAGALFLLSPGFSGAAAVPTHLVLPSDATVDSAAPAQTPTATPQAFAVLHPTDTPVPTQPPPPPPADCAPKDTEILLGTVVNVLDGVTIEVEIDGRREQVRYIGVDAGAMAASAVPASAALQYNAALVGGQTVVLVKDASDRAADGSLLRYVFAGDRFANYELVRLGLASASDSPDRACAAVLLSAQESARAAGLGIWAPTPIPTATFLPTVALDPGGTAFCDCSVRWECGNFSTHAQAQACYNACNDYNSRLDEDHDGLACEELP